VPKIFVVAVVVVVVKVAVVVVITVYDVFTTAAFELVISIIKVFFESDKHN